MSQVLPQHSLSAILPHESRLRGSRAYQYLAIGLALGVIGYMLYRKYKGDGAEHSVVYTPGGTVPCKRPLPNPSPVPLPPVPAPVKRVRRHNEDIPGVALQPQPGSVGFDWGYALPGAPRSTDPLQGLPRTTEVTDGQLVIGADDIQSAMLARGAQAVSDHHSGRKIANRAIRRDPRLYREAMADFDSLRDPANVICDTQAQFV